MEWDLYTVDVERFREEVFIGRSSEVHESYVQYVHTLSYEDYLGIFS